MKTSGKRRTTIGRAGLAIAATALALAVSTGPAHAVGTCSEVASGLRTPLGVAWTPNGNLLVAETGTQGVAHSGRISIIGADGARRTLLDGLPSGTSDVGDPSGPSGVFLRGRTLYVSIGIGDVGVLARDPRGQPIFGSLLPNPSGPSSPIFSSVLALHFSAAVEQTSEGFTLGADDEQALGAGRMVTLDRGAGDRMTVEKIVDFPNYVAAPRPGVPNNVQGSNPFKLVPVDEQLYVTDGGRNLVWQVDLTTHAFAPLVAFPAIPNPLFGIGPGGPTIDAVPTGNAAWGDQLLVALFRGAPFPPGVSSIERVDPATGTETTWIGGLKTAIAVMPLADSSLLVLQLASSGLFFGSPGTLLKFSAPGGPPALLADCFTGPSAMALDAKSGRLYVSDLTGRIVSLPLAP
jgi:sugar lactone lactonase YvrE